MNTLQSTRFRTLEGDAAQPSLAPTASLAAVRPFSPPQVSRHPSPRLQAKLTVSAVGDRYEQEADQVADQVMSAPEGAPPMRRPQGELQRDAAGGGSDDAHGSADVSHVVEQGRRGGGQPLGDDVRGFMEPRFGQDFSRVRIHTDAEASRSAEAVNALAFTVGPDIVFRDGGYAPGAEAGRRLLAHELTHVVQQGAVHPTGADNAAPSRAVSRTAAAVQRVEFAPEQTPNPEYGREHGHTPGNDYQGPSGTVTHPNQPGDVGVGAGSGLVSYGCYCGPGGDASGSRCGPGAPAVDAIDEQCRQHDTNYGLRKVDSGSVPGTHNMFTTKEGWLDAEDADQRLHDTVQSEVTNNGAAYSPSARLYAQGIQGIFGARAGVSHAAKWGDARITEAKTGVNDAINWTEGKANEAGAGIARFSGEAYNWGAGKAGEALSGAESAASSAAHWGSARAGEGVQGTTDAGRSASHWGAGKADEALSGLSDSGQAAAHWGAAKGSQAISGVEGSGTDALRWGGGKTDEALSGVGGFFNQASHWGSLGDAEKGLSGAASGALGWLGQTAHEGASGVAGAAGHAWDWLTGSAQEAGAGAMGAAGQAGHWAVNAGSEALAGASNAAGQAAGWLGRTGGQAASSVMEAGGQAAGWLGGAAHEAQRGALGAGREAAGWLGNTGRQAAGGMHRAADWAVNTGEAAASGLGGAASGIASWGAQTGRAISDVAGPAISGGIHSAENKVGGWVRSAEDEARKWLPF